MRVIVISEIASNWEGKLSIAKKIIFESKKAGADAVKFQMWRAKDLYSKKHPMWKNIKKSELTFKKAKKLKSYCDNIGIEFFCSAFYPEAVDFLETIKVKEYKVASRTCLLKDPLSLETLMNESKTKKPIIISMGMGGNKNLIKKIFSKNEKFFLYCISEYPTKFERINWKEAIKYDGFSDHTLGIIAPIIFTLLKKQKKAKKIFIEKHVKLKNSTGPDASSSIDTEELKDMISKIIAIKKIKL